MCASGPTTILHTSTWTYLPAPDLRPCQHLNGVISHQYNLHGKHRDILIQ